MPRRPIVTLGLGIAALLVAAVPGAEALAELDRSRVLVEPWRLGTGHLAHYGRLHLAYDLAAVLLLGALSEWRRPAATRWALAASLPAISLAVLALAPDVAFYRGLSGLASTLFVLHGVSELRAAPRGSWVRLVLALALVGFAGKVAFELATASSLFVGAAASFATVPVAHLAGALVGFLFALSSPLPIPVPSCHARSRSSFRCS